MKGSADTRKGTAAMHRLLLPLQFAVLLALVFAKIARIDYPRHWPSLMEDLLAVTAEGDGLRRRRAYLVLHHVLKELSSKRLAADQRTFAEVRLQPLSISRWLALWTAAVAATLLRSIYCSHTSHVRKTLNDPRQAHSGAYSSSQHAPNQDHNAVVSRVC